jgi:uncharacterized protein (DUF433 family)
VITTDPEVMGGVPCVAGTRIPVVTLVRMLADGLDSAAVLDDFPQLTRDDLSAALRYAAAALDAEDLL